MSPKEADSLATRCGSLKWSGAAASWAESWIAEDRSAAKANSVERREGRMGPAERGREECTECGAREHRGGNEGIIPDATRAPLPYCGSGDVRILPHRLPRDVATCPSTCAASS